MYIYIYLFIYLLTSLTQLFVNVLDKFFFILKNIIIIMYTVYYIQCINLSYSILLYNILYRHYISKRQTTFQFNM